jgi:Na+-transporting NADH:ubiquinone oxidoreductase subunit C
MDRNSPLYTIIFTVAVCAVCSVVVAGAYELLGAKQRADAAVFRMLDILRLTGLAAADEVLERDEIISRFEGIRPRAVDMRTGQIDPEIDASLYDQREAAKDPLTSREAPPNEAGVRRIPDHIIVFERLDAEGRIEQILLPIHGQGYGGQLYGFLSLAPDLNTVTDIIFYEHQETPTLGGKVDRPEWRASWVGRRVFDDSGQVALRLVADAGPAEQNPYQVDAVSRASVTTGGVQGMIDFWMGPEGYGPFLSQYRDTLSAETPTAGISREDAGHG